MLMLFFKKWNIKVAITWPVSSQIGKNYGLIDKLWFNLTSCHVMPHGPDFFFVELHYILLVY